MDYLLFYDYGPDAAARRAPYRAEHLAHAWAAQEAGLLILAGALADPLDGAVLHFRAPSPEVVEAYARADPYVIHGIASNWRIRPWTTVVGDAAATPIRPVDLG